MSIPGPSSLLSIPYFTISKPYPEINNVAIININIPINPNPPAARMLLLDACEIIASRLAPPKIPAIIPIIIKMIKDLMFFIGYTTASPIISPISIFFHLIIKLSI